jgi:hypothetical protein
VAAADSVVDSAAADLVAVALVEVGSFDRLSYLFIWSCSVTFLFGFAQLFFYLLYLATFLDSLCSQFKDLKIQ